MVRERRLFLDEIGGVSIKKRKGIRRMSLKVNQKGEVILNIPFLLSFREAEKFLYSKVEWIKKGKIKMAEKAPPKIIYSAENILPTQHHEFLVQKTEKEKFFARFSTGLCEIFIPVSEEISNEGSQTFISFCIIETLRKEAKIILVDRTRELATKNGFDINEIRIKNMQSRWGSCSIKGNINLNLHLMRLPKHLSDYVILHELAHTKHHNHGPLFWQELDKHVKNSKALAKELKSWNTVI